MRHVDSITEETLKTLIEAGSVRAVRVVESGAGGFALTTQIGLNEKTLKSKRQDVRIWRDMDTVHRYCREQLGINQYEVIGR